MLKITVDYDQALLWCLFQICSSNVRFDSIYWIQQPSLDSKKYYMFDGALLEELGFDVQLPNPRYCSSGDTYTTCKD